MYVIDSSTEPAEMDKGMRRERLHAEASQPRFSRRSTWVTVIPRAGAAGSSELPQVRSAAFRGVSLVGAIVKAGMPKLALPSAGLHKKSAGCFFAGGGGVPLSEASHLASACPTPQ